MKKRCPVVLLSCVLFVLTCLTSIAGSIAIPDIPGYKTLKCDFHTHTVFSDGNVWPTVRIDEAKREGLDAIAITDHIEYHPHQEDVSKDVGRAYDVAVKAANRAKVILIRGAEITKGTPPGHFNAIFITNSAPLYVEDYREQITTASGQKGFVFWNHPDWKGANKAVWTPIADLYTNDHIHGIEIINGRYVQNKGYGFALEKDLTFLGNSDIHAPSLIKKTTHGEHRTMTLVFAKERTAEAIKEALFAKRTAAWGQDRLVGREEYIRPLYEACVKVTAQADDKKAKAVYTLANNSVFDFELKFADGRESVKLASGATQTIEEPYTSNNKTGLLQYSVPYFQVGKDKPLEVKHHW